METTITDSLGNTITMKYDTDTDSVFVKNSLIGDTFMEVTKNTAVTEDVIMMEDHKDYSNWSDLDTRDKLREFWDEHKKTK
jgi:hypothetical protein